MTVATLMSRKRHSLDLAPLPCLRRGARSMSNGRRVAMMLALAGLLSSCSDESGEPLRPAGWANLETRCGVGMLAHPRGTRLYVGGGGPGLTAATTDGVTWVD